MALTKIDDRGLKTPIDLQDNEKIRLGTGNDLEIYSDGNTSFLKSDDLRIRSAGDEEMLRGVANGAVELYYNNSKKFETTSTGCLLRDDVKLTFGDDTDFQLYHLNGGYSYLRDFSGIFYLQTNNFTVTNNAGDETLIRAVNNGAVKLYHNNSQKLETTSWGTQIYGALAATGNIDCASDTGKIKAGASADLEIYHDGGDTHIDNHTGHLKIRGGAAGNILLEPRDGEPGIYSKLDGATELYYDGTKRFETSSDGVIITSANDSDCRVKGDFKFCAVDGTLEAMFDASTAQLEFLDNSKATFGSGDDLRIYHDGTSSYLSNTTGNLYIEAKSGETAIQIVPDGSTDLRYDGNKKIETVSDGVNINGASFDTHIKFLGNKFLSRSRWGYSTGYSGVTLGRTDATTNSTIFMGVDTSSNASGAFTGDGREIVFRNNHKFIVPNAANNNYVTPMVLNGGQESEGVPKFPQGVLVGNNTANANILDDYEEGTFTASLGSSGGGASFASGGTTTGHYVKVGSSVSVQIYFSGANISNAGSGVCVISGLPFTSNSSSYYTLAITHNTMTQSTLENGYVQYGNTIFYPIRQNATGGSSLNAGNPRYMMIGGWYPAS